MKIIEKIKTNKLIENQTEIQKICLDKLQLSPLPNPKSEQWRLSNKSKFSNFLDYSVNEKNPKFDTPFPNTSQSTIRLVIGDNCQINLIEENYSIKQLSEDKLVKEKLEIVKMDQAFLSRSVNQGFSGGEKKRNEILQMALLEPKIAILDETDSGLDIDALRIVASGIKKISNAQTGIILITHYQRLLDEIKPNYVHVMSDGQIIKTGESDLALELEKKGYEWTDNFIKET